MKVDLEKNKTIKIILLAITYVFIIVFLFVRTFATNDDVGIMLNIRNNYDPQFMSNILGKIISLFYMMQPKFPWYALFIYMFHVLILIILIKACVKIKILKDNLLILLIVIAITYQGFISAIGYNSTAILLGFVGIFYLYLYMQRESVTNRGIILLSVMPSMAYLLRKDSVLILGLFLLPIGIYILMKLKKRSIYLFIPLMIFFALEKSIEMTQSIEEKKYKEFNQARGFLHFDYSYELLENREMLEKNNWSRNEFWLFLHWFFIDEAKYNTVKLKTALSYVKKGNAVKKI